MLSGDWSAGFPDIREVAKTEIIKPLRDPDPGVRGSTMNDRWEMDRNLALKLGIQPIRRTIHH